VTPRDDATATAHWDEVYATRVSSSLSWFQREPVVSLRLVEAHATTSSGIVDVGAGASLLLERLVERGYLDLTALDFSREALDQVAARVEPGRVSLVASDVLAWRPARHFDLWHDRALLHFLVEPGDQRRYVDVAARALRPGAVAVIGVFAPDGPAQCSGLAVARFDASDLAEVFGPAFVLEASEREVHVTPAGVDQPFTWAVLRRAQK
jgi:SAM-dependent methyltransferase